MKSYDNSMRSPNRWHSLADSRSVTSVWTGDVKPCSINQCEHACNGRNNWWKYTTKSQRFVNQSSSYFVAMWRNRPLAVYNRALKASQLLSIMYVYKLNAARIEETIWILFDSINRW